MKHIFKKNQIIITALAVMIAVAGYLNYSGTKLGDETAISASGKDGTKKESGTDTALIDIESLDADVEDLDTAEGETSAKEDSKSADASDVTDLNEAAALENSAAAGDAALTADGDDPSADNAAADLSDDGSVSDSASADPVSDDASADTAGVSEGAVADSTDVQADGSDGSQESADGNTGTPGEAVLTSSAAASSFAAEAKLSREQVRAKNKETLLEVINNENIEQQQKQDAIDSMNGLTEIAEREAAAELMLEAKGFANSVVSITDDQADVVVAKAELSEAERAQIEDIVKRKTNVAGENIVITPMSVKAEE